MSLCNLFVENHSLTIYWLAVTEEDAIEIPSGSDSIVEDAPPPAARRPGLRTRNPPPPAPPASPSPPPVAGPSTMARFKLSPTTYRKLGKNEDLYK